ncbi:MAG: radical SAM protein [Victivallaceae bacterium]|jgi:radical SAM protein with 4Fe4S-binding SPASM domain
MSDSYIISEQLPEFSLWDKMRKNRNVISFDLELTARCNNNCRHCYINRPVNDNEAGKKELTFDKITKIADEAVSLGAFWCLITGGEPLLREDFEDIYVALKKRGLLLSVFTNAVLAKEKHIELFKKYPPRDIEISVYGVTKETYEKVTRIPGSFEKFMRGVDLLLNSGIKVRFKAMALRSNVHELPEIAEFCRRKTRDYFRFDPQLHLRFDGNLKGNEEIKGERLSPEEIVVLEKSDTVRFQALEKNCDKLINPKFRNINCNHLFHCGAGNWSFSVSYDGYFRLCSSLWHPDCIYDLKTGSLTEAWNYFVPKVRSMTSSSREFLEKCRKCPIINFCMWCPAHCYLETGKLDEPVDVFCKIAHARAESLNKEIDKL